jgi:hypothetical protein
VLDEPRHLLHRTLTEVIEDVIERWAGKPGVRSFHRRVVDTDPEALWDAAKTVRLSDTRTLGRLVRWRIPGTPADITFHELFATYPFTVLEEGPTWSLSGLAGKIWTFQRDYPRLAGPEDYEAWDRPGTVRVLFAHWTRPAEGGGAELVSDCRVSPVDRRAAVRLKTLWALISQFERLIGAEPLNVAESRARGRRAPSPR